MDLKYSGKKIIAAVAQFPFDKGPNIFCKLIPLFNHLDRYDQTLDPKEFFNDGEIWWRLSRDTKAETIVPGMMMELMLEPSKDIDNADEKSLYQARFLTREEPIEAMSGAEIFNLSNDAEKLLYSLKGNGNQLQFAHIPSKQIYLRVKEHIYGPFSTTIISGDYKNFIVKSTITSNGRAVIYRIPTEEFAKHYTILSNNIMVSWERNGTKIAKEKRTMAYEYLSPYECMNIRNDYNEKWEEIDWEPLSVKFGRMTKSIQDFTRNDRNQLKTLIEKLEHYSDNSNFANELQQALAGVKKLSENEAESLCELGKALTNRGALLPDLDKRIEEKRFPEWLQENKDRINEQIGDLEDEKGNLEKKKDALEKEIEKDKKKRKDLEKEETAKLNAKLEKQKELATRELEKEKEVFESDFRRKSLELDEKLQKLEMLKNAIVQDSEKNAANCIAMFPFFKELFTVPTREIETAGVPTKSSTQIPAAAPINLRSAFALPQSLHIPSAAAKSAIAEDAFLERLHNYAASEGYSFNHDDLRRFHLSVLCEQITIVEGPSGVGKSSLARLYGDVLAGNEGIAPRNGTHIVHVSPSWMERADLLGYVNTVSGEFTPSETGLYQQLIYADYDHRTHNAQSGMYPICLDEMNLAQVEHYFSDFMQILELPAEKRILKCFSLDSVVPNAVFKDYAEIKIAPSIRFIGTVNFDETTRRLSSRLLDRVNLVYLSDRDRTGSWRSDVDAGPGVTFGLYDSWRRDAALSGNIEKILGALAEPLRRLGAIISPRVRNSMARYIASSVLLLGDDIKTENRAFDEQFAQRVLSKIRTLTSLAQKKALDDISIIIDGIRENDSPSNAAIERIRAKERFFGYENEG